LEKVDLEKLGKIMRICVNNEWREVGAAVLDKALFELGYKDAVVATAVNGQFVATQARADTPLTEGDRIEIVAPMQGG
jgi:sulfur carrier protein